MKKVGLVLLTLLFCGACAPAVKPQRTDPEPREFQSRSYPTDNVNKVMDAVVTALQEDGYVVKTATFSQGLIAATKEVDIENKGTAALSGLLAGDNARWSKTSAIECSGNVRAYGQETRVSVNFQVKKLNNKGEALSVERIRQPTFYLGFFSKVDNAMSGQK